MHAFEAPQQPTFGWTRTTDARWQRVELQRGTGARCTAAALAAHPGATIHGVVTDVLGAAQVHLVTANGEHVVMRCEAITGRAA